MHRIFGALAVGCVALAGLKSPLAGAEAEYMGGRMPYEAFDRLEHVSLQVAGGRLDVGFAPSPAGPFTLPRDALLAWIRKSAEAVSVYYGRFPVRSARILIVPAGGAGIGGAQAFGYRGPAIRLQVGTETSQAELDADWKGVHEMVHLALADVAAENLWLAEGLAVYVESIARVQAGHLSAQKIWSEFVRDMPRGLPHAGDGGLDRTHTWGRTYWGGAIFYLLADVEIRRRTGNRLGLQHAMRAVVAAGGTHDQDWETGRILATADKAVGVPVLSELYAKMASNPYDPGLDQLWHDLGVTRTPAGVAFDDSAPLAAIRRAITMRPAETLTR